MEKNISVREKWFISDTHFFHASMLKFKDDGGGLIRPFKANLMKQDASPEELRKFAQWASTSQL